jgi:hypothetical protein
MLKPDQGLALKLLKLSVSSDEFQETLQLKKQIKKALKEREVPYLSALELDQILRWKLDKQYHRSKQQREINVDEVVIPITRACFSIRSEDRDYEIELKLKTLTTMRGVAIPLASAILAICFPNDFVVIDSLLWELIYEEEKSSFTVTDYLKFLSFFTSLSQHTKRSLQDTEHLLWLYQQSLG